LIRESVRHDDNDTFQQRPSSLAAFGSQHTAFGPGTKFSCEILGDSVILPPEHPRRSAREYVIDPLTGLRVRKAPDHVESVTTEIIKSLLEDYP
jgi:hypothetical protein